ncbi:MAG: aminoglycoside phosphotransferase family protein [Thermomicrobiales bacterium]
MLQKPPIADEALAASVRASYGIIVAHLEFLPLGEDNDAGVYRVTAADGPTYFLKVRSGTLYPPSVTVPRALREADMSEVVAPLPTITPEPWGTVGEFAVLLYPFVEGKSGWGANLTPAQWGEYGAIFGRLHATQLPPAIAQTLPRETFIPSARPRRVVEALLAGEHERGDDGEATHRLAAFVREHREEIARILRRAEELGQALQATHPDLVLCHADCHPANILIDATGHLRVVDWDQPMLAPRERDLMFLIGPTFTGFTPGSPEAAAFFAHYGAVTPDPITLAYYRYEWAMQDIGGFAERIFLTPGLEEATKLGAMGWLDVLFHPDGIANAAYQTETLLPPGV